MPTLSVFIRKDDVPKWKALENKSEFLHNALFALNDSKILRTPKLHKQFDNVTSIEQEIKLPKVTEAKVQSIKINIPDTKAANGVCKIHGTPLDDRGRCLTKGCKYA